MTPKLAWKDGRYSSTSATAGHFTLTVEWQSDGSGYAGQVRLGAGNPVRTKKSYSAANDAMIACEAMARKLMRDALTALGEPEEK
jgi:hypothetical protein